MAQALERHPDYRVLRRLVPTLDFQREPLGPVCTLLVLDTETTGLEAAKEKVIELVGPGSSFGEALMFTGRPYIINGQSLTDTLLLTVKKDAVVGEIERDPRFAMRMLAGISRRLHGLVRDVEAYALHSGVQRVIGYLLRDAAEGADNSQPMTVSLEVSKATVASRLSLTPEYFSRVLHELEASGLVRIDKRDVHILDRDRLAAYPG